MQLPQVNYLAVFVAGIVIFLLGGLWYSPVLFGKRWTALQGRTEEQTRAQAAAANMPVMYLSAFICGLIIAWAMAVLANAFVPKSLMPTGSWVLRGAELGLFAWFGFAAATSFANAIFSMKPKQLWLIDSLYNLVSFILAGMIIMGWTGATVRY
jgi:hypothetical protein